MSVLSEEMRKEIIQILKDSLSVNVEMDTEYEGDSKFVNVKVELLVDGEVITSERGYQRVD